MFNFFRNYEIIVYSFVFIGLFILSYVGYKSLASTRVKYEIVLKLNLQCILMYLCLMTVWKFGASPFTSQL